MKRNLGFTLVELLVVIAIIAILAGIVIPNVPKFINKARATRAYAEIKGIDLALTKMLSDADRADFKNGFFDVSQANPWPTFPGTPKEQIARTYTPGTIASQADLYSQLFYILLRKGKYAPEDSGWPAGIVLNADVQRKLGDSYMDLGKDPWGQMYNFYAGPFTPLGPTDTVFNLGGKIMVPFRIYRYSSDVPGGIVDDAYTRDVTDPDSSSTTPFAVGWPAPRKMTHFVWSCGKNRKSNQVPDAGFDAAAVDVGLDFLGGGDDINNWDNDQSWISFYN